MNALQNEFMKMAVPLAQSAQKRWGVPASVTIAQAILESSDERGWGQSDLARECNNFFGIKAGHGAAPDTYKVFSTHEYVHGQLETVPAEFVRYEDPAGSFDAHARLLAIAPRYRAAMAVCHDPAAFAAQLQACGYSTNPKYAQGLMAIVRDYDLTQYDIPPSPPAQAQEIAA